MPWWLLWCHRFLQTRHTHHIRFDDNFKLVAMVYIEMSFIWCVSITLITYHIVVSVMSDYVTQEKLWSNGPSTTSLFKSLLQRDVTWTATIINHSIHAYLTHSYEYDMFCHNFYHNAFKLHGRCVSNLFQTWVLTSKMAKIYLCVHLIHCPGIA